MSLSSRSNLLLDAAAVAWEERRGAWAAFGEDLLLGYEYRAAIKLGVKKLEDPAAAIADAYQRHCVDLRDLRWSASSTTTRSHPASQLPLPPSKQPCCR